MAQLLSNNSLPPPVVRDSAAAAAAAAAAKKHSSVQGLFLLHASFARAHYSCCSCTTRSILRPMRSSSVSPLFAKLGSRFALYGDRESYVLIEPGQDELFVDVEELRARLKGWLENWPGSTLPEDLARFGDLDEAVTYLVDSACELELSDGSGAVQWFEVQL